MALLLPILAVSIMTTLAFGVGRGDTEMPNTLAVIAIDMGDFAEFNWTKIAFVDKPQTRQLVRRIDISSVTNKVGDGINKASGQVGTVVSGAEDKVKNATSQIANKAKDLVDEVGDNIGDIKDIVEKLVMKVLAKIEDQLNEWGLRVVRKLNELGISQRYSLHTTTWCRVPRSVEYTNGTTKFSTAPQNCTSLFGEGQNTTFDPVANGGKIFSFSPGDLIANVTSIFLMPKDVQQKIREPIDKGCNTVQREITNASNSLKRGVMLFTFGPTMIVYAVACGCAWLLLLGLVGEIVYGFTLGRKHPDGKRTLAENVFGFGAFFKLVPAVTLYALLIASVIVSAVSLITGIVDIMTQAVHIRIGGGSGLVAMSWASFILILMIRVVLNEQLKDADAEQRTRKREKYGVNNHLDMARYPTSPDPSGYGAHPDNMSEKHFVEDERVARPGY
ncbi:hypothetical protein PG993_013549 [Apiospora rasikravindrae]|uniref:Uncharacterized protein n=1 Tax=Apiospora rasikravindrae TaxID=990691 RepID=A0ABR1RXX9_9PEZI